MIFVTVSARAEDGVMQILYNLFTPRADIRVSALNSMLRLDARAYSFIGGDAEA